MRIKITIILIGLNLGLFGLIYYLEKEAATVGAFESAKRLVFPPGFVEDSDRLEIDGRGLTHSWVLVREMDHWYLDKPINWPANIYAVSRMINQLKFLEWETRFSVNEIKKAGRSLEDYGLKNPKAVLTLSQGNMKKEIKIGESTEIGKRLYILSPAEEEVFVVNRDLLQSLTLDLQDLRSQNIFDIPLFEVRSLSIQITDPGNLKVRLARIGDDWIFESPIQTNANTQHVNSTINQLTGLKVIDFQGADRVQEILANPALRITLEGNNRRQTLLVGEAVREEGNGKKTKYFASMEDNSTVFTLAAAPINELLNVQESLREKKFVLFDPSELKSIDISISDNSVELQKLETGTWQVLKSNKIGELSAWTADSQLMNDVINSLHDIEAVRFISDAPSAADLEKYGFNDPQRRVVFRSQDEQTLLIGDLDPGSRLLFAKMEAAPFIYQVRTYILHLLKVSALYYRLRVIEELPQGARVKKIILVDIENDTSIIDIEIDLSNESWSDALIDYPEKKQYAILDLIDVIRKFEVKEYLSDSYSHSYQQGNKVIPWKYRLEADIHLPGGEEDRMQTRMFSFSDRIGGTTQIGGSPDAQVIFAINQKLIDALFELTFDPIPPVDKGLAQEPLPTTDEPDTSEITTQDASSPSENIPEQSASEEVKP